MPLGKLPPEMVREILEGGAAVCARAGIPVAGGHSIDSPEPIYGLAVIGTGKAETFAAIAMPRPATLDPHQGDRRRHLLGRVQEERVVACGL